MRENLGNLRKILIIALSLVIMAAVFIAGITIAALGFIFLPLLFFRKNDSNIVNAQQGSQKQTIDAEFQRVDNQPPKN